MDKVLKYKFWILTGLVFPLALAGFFMSQGSVQGKTQERIGQIEQISVADPNQPSDPQTALARERAAELARENDAQLRLLDQVQRSWMTWPPQIEEGLELDPETNQLVYRGENLRRDAIKYQYGDYYRQQMEQLYYSVNPVVGPSPPAPYPSKNKVFITKATIPHYDFPRGRTPSVHKIWDAQEDYWILQKLFAAINRTNEAAEDVNSAPIREIKFIRLFGGTGTPELVSSATEGQSGGELYGDPGTTQQKSGPTVVFGEGTVAFEVAEEYGPAIEGGTGPGAGESSGGGFLDGGSAPVEELRYIGYSEGDPVRQRGYYLSLLIDESSIPDLIVNLANTEPPISVDRMAFGNNPYDTDPLMMAVTTGRRGGRGSEMNYDAGRGGTTGGAWPLPAAGSGRRSLYGDESPMASTGDTLLDPMSAYERSGVVPGSANAAVLAALEKYQDARTSNKDLVRLDLSGRVSLFFPEVPQLEPQADDTETAEQAPGQETDSPDGATPPPEGPVDPAAPEAPTDPAMSTDPQAPANPGAPQEPPVPDDPGAPTEPPPPIEPEAPVPEAPPPGNPGTLPSEDASEPPQPPAPDSDEPPPVPDESGSQ